MKVAFESTDFKGLPILSDPEILGGRPVFVGTRVPVDALWNNLADGASLDEFLEWFPTVSREQAEQVMHFGFESLAKAA
jgi:uncharacterized protein (DUF433 family)